MKTTARFSLNIIPAASGGFFSRKWVLFLSIFIFFLSFTAIFPQSILAQIRSDQNTNPNVPENSYTKIQIMLIDLSGAIICQLVGIDVIDRDRGCLGIDPKTKKIGYVSQNPDNPQVGGLLGMVVYSTETLYTPPASGVDYTKNIARNFGIVKPALAQENEEQDYTGFTALQPVQYVWTVARNITYFFFVIAFVIIGIGIMLRVKINPQTVMSIQNQIPKITVAIIMITFSYAIVGFLIDLMWVSTYFVINTLTPAVTVTGDSDAQAVKEMATMNLYNNPLTYFNDLFDSTHADHTSNVMGSMAKEIGMTVGDVISKIVFSVFNIDAASLDCSWTELQNCGTALFYNLIRGIAGLIGMMIIAIALIVAAVRTWFMLIKSYLYIILYTIIGPIYIFMGILPGSTLGFGAWMRAIIVNLLAFPSVIALYLLARFFAVSNSPYSYEQAINTQYNPFLPPLISNPSLLNNVGLLIAFGLVMLTPEMVQILRDKLNAKPNPYVAPAVQRGFSVGASASSAFTGAFIGRSFAVKGGVPIGWAARKIHSAGLTNNNRDARPIVRTLTAPLRFALGTKPDK